jgi:uncharacterized glyoxalase superfamily protein PhnB
LRSGCDELTPSAALVKSGLARDTDPQAAVCLDRPNEARMSRGMVSAVIRQIAPQFFALDIPATLAYYREKLGFECLGTWQDPPVYAIVARDRHNIHFRCAEPPAPNPDKYADELLDAYLFVDDADALYAEYAARGVEFTRALGDTPWHSREFVVKDCDGRLLAFGANSD